MDTKHLIAEWKAGGGRLTAPPASRAQRGVQLPGSAYMSESKEIEPLTHNQPKPPEPIASWQKTIDEQLANQNENIQMLQQELAGLQESLDYLNDQLGQIWPRIAPNPQRIAKKHYANRYYG